MPIRKRISDPFGDEVKKFERRLRDGAPPPAPKKPSAGDREPFVSALKAVPVGEIFARRDFYRKVLDRAIKDVFPIWGQLLYLMPVYRHIDGDRIECTGCSIGRMNPNKRGVKPMLRLHGEARTWYSQVLHWIEETEYD